MKRLFFIFICLCCITFSAYAEEVNSDVLDVQEDNQIVEHELESDGSTVTIIQEVIKEPVRVYTVENPVSTFAMNGDIYVGSLSSSNLDYLSGFVPDMYDYVIYRNSQYSYVAIFGTDFSSRNGIITYTNAEIIILDVSNDYNSGATVSRSTGSGVVNRSDAAYVYSNLDGFSQSDVLRRSRNEKFTQILLFALFLGYFLRYVLFFRTR